MVEGYESDLGRVAMVNTDVYSLLHSLSHFRACIQPILCTFQDYESAILRL